MAKRLESFYIISFTVVTESGAKRTLPPPPPPTTDTDKSEGGSKSEGEDELPQPPAKRGLGRTPNHLTLRYPHMYGRTDRAAPTYTALPALGLTHLLSY